MTPEELQELSETNRLLRELIDLIRANAARPKPKKLIGWKQILAVSAEHGGPGSENRLRDICRRRGAPVQVWRGMAAVTVEDRFILWLEGLRVPIALEPLGASGKGRRRSDSDGKSKPKSITE